MDERIAELAEEFAEQECEAMLAEGSALEAIRTGQFDRAHEAVDAANAAWAHRLELRDEIVGLINAKAGFSTELPG